MSRTLPAALASALGDGVVRPTILFDAEFTSGWVYLWNGYGDLVFGGNTYKGTGDLIQLSSLGETGAVQAIGITATLAGLDLGMTSIALQEIAQNQIGRVWFGLRDDSGNWIGGAPTVAFSGRLDLAKIAESPPVATVAINYESRLANLEVPRIWSWTDQDQQTTSPGDLGCQYTGAIADQILQWGG